MARIVRFLQHVTLGDFNYLPGQVVSLSDDDAARMVSALRAVYTGAAPTPPHLDPYPRYVEITDLSDPETPAFKAIVALLGAGGGGGGGGLVEDVTDPGTYIVAAGGGGGLVEDVTDPGTYIVAGA